MLDPDKIEIIEQFLADHSNNIDTASKAKLTDKLNDTPELSNDIKLIKKIKESVCLIEKDKFKSTLRTLNNDIKQENKKRKIQRFYYSVAASLLLIIGISAFYISNKNNQTKLADLQNKKDSISIKLITEDNTVKSENYSVAELNNNPHENKKINNDSNTVKKTVITSPKNKKTKETKTDNNELKEALVENINYASVEENDMVNASNKQDIDHNTASNTPIKQKGKYIKVKKVFSINNDSIGFIPEGNKLKLYRISVYDNSGKLVWKSSKLNNGKPSESWDGKCNGKLLSAGNYRWKIEALFNDGTVWKGLKNKDGNHKNSGILTIKK